ncbi:MAG: amidophosphoribosyltransferase [Ignavibacteriae bacterium]|nr:amidophosphoribosyltransferase [Ignavibacteriota bacterium]
MNNFKDEIDKPRSNCGIVGVYGNPQASIMTYYALHALQHRGQEAAGITTFYPDEKTGRKRFAYTRGEGLVLDVFSDPKILTDVLKGDMAIGHNRYSTTGSSKRANIQPFTMRYNSGILSISHNGNLTNTDTLWKQLQNDGAIFQTTSDSELFLHLIARSKQPTIIERIREALRTAKGAYSLVILTEDSLIAARDPHGFRPLSIGRLKVGDSYSYMVASETCAFDIVSAEYIRSLEHNEMIVINRKTLESGEIESYKIEDITPEARHCIFEYIYFSRPDSKIFNHNVDKVRRKLGKNLAEESQIKSDEGEKITAIAVPDSGNTATLGYVNINNKQNNPTVFEIGLIRSHYVGRTFIAPGQDNREFKVKVKFNPVKGVIENRNVVMIDDSIVRGTTSKSLINLVREAEPKQLHMRITSPPIKYPCHYGMDFPSREELIANDYKNEEEIGKAIGVDSLHYLSIEKLLESVPQDKGVGYCTACFTGKYPVPIDANHHKLSTEE